MLRHCLGLIALSAATLSCQGLERVDECNEVARLINPVLVNIERERTVVRGNTYRVIATKYEALASASGMLKIRTKRVAEALNDYQHMLHEAARDARAFALAVESKDEARIAVERAAAARTMRHEATAVARIDAVCRVR